MSEILRTTPVGIVKSEEYAFDNKFFPIIRLTVTDLTGEKRDQLVWDRRGKTFVTALAMTEDGKFVMVKEPKYGQERIMLTVPGGGVKKDETPEMAAARELTEETGYTADRWEILKEGVVDFPDKTAGGQHFLLLGFNAKKVNEPEDLRSVHLFSRDQLEGILDDQIEEAKLDIAMSLTTILLSLRYLDNNP